MNKKNFIITTGLVSLITGILFFVFKKNVEAYTVSIVGAFIIILGLLKFFNNIKYASNNKLRNLTIAEVVVVVVLGAVVLVERNSTKYINYFMGAPLYLTSLSYFWQLNTRSGYTVRLRSFVLNVMLITIGSNLLLSDFNIHRLLLQLATVLTAYGAVVVIYLIVTYSKKKA